jgi:cyclic pyranopterin phosphate synthase
MSTIAESFVRLSQTAFETITGRSKGNDAFTAARIAGMNAARKTADIIPFRQPQQLADIVIDFEAVPARSSIRIVVTANGTGNLEMEALLAASIAALTIRDMAQDKDAEIAGVKLVSAQAAPALQSDARSTFKSIGTALKSAPARGAPKPSVLMGEVAAPRAAASGPGDQREAFRTFMTSRHLRATQWAKDAEVPAAQILAFLTGRLRTLPIDTAERLAKAARVRVEDMFR